jgi:hypothetical protein
MLAIDCTSNEKRLGRTANYESFARIFTRGEVMTCSSHIRAVSAIAVQPVAAPAYAQSVPASTTKTMRSPPVNFMGGYVIGSIDFDVLFDKS